MKNAEYIQEWLQIEKKKERKYHHFDIRVNVDQKIQSKDPQSFFEDFLNEKNISERGFWPFIHFEKIERKYKKGAEKPKDRFSKKIRKIYYASHLDSCILSYYSFLIGKKYEEFLLESKLSENIIAYRKIDGKNSIQFAKQVFEDIVDIQDCFVYTFDISNFFDELNWESIIKAIKKILKVRKIKKDWQNILNNITNYTFLNKEDIDKYNLFDPKTARISTEKFQKVRKEVKLKKQKILHKNSEKGIAQGTPISGMLANIYMLEFDKAIKKYIEKRGGKYYRYSDDILVIVPHENKVPIGNFEEKIKEEIFNRIEEEPILLKIQNKKTEIFDFRNGKLACSFHILEGQDIFNKDEHPRPLQYLGFTFDGTDILIRNKTLGKHNFKMIESFKKLARLKPTKKRPSRIKGGEIKIGEISKRFTHLGAKKTDKKYGNFYGYILNANESMNDLQKKIGSEGKIKRQMRKYPKNFKKALEKYIKNDEKDDKK